MKTKLVFMVLLTICFSCSNNNKDATDIEILKNLELTRLKSLVDANIEIAKRLHADDFQLITPDGSEYDKQDYLGQIESGVLDYKIWDADTIRVRMYDNVAVIRYNDKDFQVYIDGELAKSGILKHTNLYEKRNGQWKIVWSHASGGTEPKSSLLQSANELQAQSAQPKLNQVELMKQFLGSWKCEVSLDTIAFWTTKSYGTGLENRYNYVKDGRIVVEGKQLWGYDKTIDKFYATTLQKGKDIYIDIYYFISTNKCRMYTLYDIENPEKAPVRWEIEFKSPDMFLETYISNNEPFKIRTFTRIR